MHYFTYTDSMKMHCYLELDARFYCQSVIYFSELDNDYYGISWLNFYDQPYPIPEACFKDKINKMKPILETEFETFWLQKDKEFVGMKTVLKHLRIK